MIKRGEVLKEENKDVGKNKKKFLNKCVWTLYFKQIDFKENMQATCAEQVTDTGNMHRMSNGYR